VRGEERTRRTAPRARSQQFQRERNEALEQQAATVEILTALSRSKFDLQSLLESLLEKAVGLCGAERGLLYRPDGDVYRAVASYGHSNEFLEKVVMQNPIPKDRTSATGRAVVERRVAQIRDILADPDYHWAGDQRHHEGMHRTILAAPMLKEDAIIGVIVIRINRGYPYLSSGSSTVYRKTDQASTKLRRSSGNRDRERAAVR